MVKLLIFGALLAGGVPAAQAKIFVCVAENGRVHYSISSRACATQDLTQARPPRAAPTRQRGLRAAMTQTPARAADGDSPPAATPPAAALTGAPLTPMIVLDNVLAQAQPVALNEKYNLTALAANQEHKRIKILLTELEKEKEIINAIRRARAQFGAAPDFQKVFNRQINYHILNVQTLTAELKNLNFFF